MKLFQSMAVLIAGILSALYLLNIGVGVFELLPDNIPLAGNLDEALAALVLANSLAYFGFDTRRLLGRRRERSPRASRQAAPVLPAAPHPGDPV